MSIEHLIHRSKVASYWLFGGHMLIQAFSWFITIYIARLLSPSDYGLFGMASLAISFMTIFNELGFSDALVQKKYLRKEEISSAFWIIVLVNIGFYGFLFIVSEPISVFFREVELKKIIRLIAITVVIGGIYKIPFSLLTRNIQFKKRTFAVFVGKLGGAISALYFASNGYGVWSLVYGFIVDDLIKLILLFYFTRWFPTLRIRLGEVKQLFRFGYKVAIGRLLKYLSQNSDYVIAGKVLGKISLGYYTFAFQLVSLPQEKFVSLAGQILFPFFSRLQDDYQKVAYYFLKTIRILFLFILPIFVGALLIVRTAVMIFLTNKWLPMVLPFKILALVGVLRCLDVVRARLTVALGRPEIELSNNLVLVIILSISFYIGALYGLAGLSYAWLIAYPPVFYFMMYRTLQLIDLRFLDILKAIKGPAISTLFMSCIILIFKLSQYYLIGDMKCLLLTILIGVVTYISSMFLFFRESLKEFYLFLKLSNI